MKLPLVLLRICFIHLTVVQEVSAKRAPNIKFDIEQQGGLRFEPIRGSVILSEDAVCE
jgi:hypothetical protein